MASKNLTYNKPFDAFTLKLFAIIAMLINHIGIGFHIGLSHPYIFLFTETIGKLTFPIMAYLLVEGFYHTKNLKKYALRLTIFWIISIIPFHVYFNDNWNFQFSDLFNNVLFTLLMGLLMIMAYEKFKSFFIVLIFSLFTTMSDWSLFGPLIIFGYYKIKDERFKILFPVLYTALPNFLITVMARLVDPNFEKLYFISGIGMLGMFLTVPILLNYNKKRGYSPTWVKYGFYLFYPLHLTVLYIIRNLIF